MKRLINYIFESFDEYRISDLVAKYICNPDDEYVQFYVPATYSEDDFIIYLGDLYFEELPGSDKFNEKYFGKNANNIYDIFFEYERYEKGVESKGNFINWNKDKDTNHDPDKEEFTFVQVKGLKYVLLFEKFDLKDIDNKNIDETLNIIFSAANANLDNKFPLNIKFDNKNIEYKEE